MILTIMSLSIKTLSIKTLSIKTLSIMTLSITLIIMARDTVMLSVTNKLAMFIYRYKKCDTPHNDTHHNKNDAQHNCTRYIVMVSVVMSNVL